MKSTVWTVDRISVPLTRDPPFNTSKCASQSLSHSMAYALLSIAVRYFLFGSKFKSHFLTLYR
jgi:hypothetical protein